MHMTITWSQDRKDHRY